MEKQIKIREKYSAEQKELWKFKTFIISRRLRFASNLPVKKEHYLELDFLIANFDLTTQLLKKYYQIISDETIDKWLENNCRYKTNFSCPNNYIYSVSLPFYILFPNTKNPSIDKYFLKDQLLLTLSSIDNKYRKYRLRAIQLFEFLTPYFGHLEQNLQLRIIEILTDKANHQNIRFINKLVIKNQSYISPRLINLYIESQLKKSTLKPVMAIEVLRNLRAINFTNKQKLMLEIAKYGQGNYILSKEFQHLTLHKDIITPSS